MHEFKVEYKENNCSVEIGGKDPYLILNLEKYCKLKNFRGLSHCDFICIVFKDDKCEIFIIELKDTEEIKKETLEGILDKVIDNKFPQTLNLIKDIIKFFNIRNAKYYGVLVLPFIDRIRALSSHFNNKFANLKKKSFDNVWVTPCGENVWQRMF